MIDGGHGPRAIDEIMVFRNTVGAIAGAIYIGTQLVIAADDEAAIDAFALETRRHPHFRSFVGSQWCVERLWERVRGWHRPPVLTRARQPLYVLFPDALAPVATTSVTVRQATLDDAPTVTENSAAMMLGELGYDPRENRASFGAGIRRAINLGQWWVSIEGGELRFQLNVGARTPATAQLQGVWTPPAARKRGYARAALSLIAARLLESNPTLSLYVNDFNHDAIALYERTGFVCVGTMSTLLFA